MMTGETSAVVQSIDSDYETWSSSSSDRCFELQNLASDYGGSFNNLTSTSCSCYSENPIDYSFYISENTFGFDTPKNALGSYSQRKAKWKGIRMGITIDYNSIKAQAEKFRRKQKISAENALKQQSAPKDKSSVNASNGYYATQCSIRYCAAENSATDQETSMCTIINSDDDDHLVTESECSFALDHSNALQSTPINRSRQIPFSATRSVRRIPQEIINNAKIITCKVAIVGARKTGKSSLAKRQFLNEVFFGESEDEADSIIRRQNDRSSEGISSRFMIDIIDGDNDEQNILRADAIVLIYSITDKKSFTEVTNLYRSVVSTRTHSIPLVLVGTKTDVDKKKRRISSFEGQSLARRFNCPFIEVSAKTNDRVHEAFVELMRLVDKQQARFCRLKRSLAPVLL